MPNFPAWYGKIPEILGQLELFPAPFLDRRALQNLIGVSPRRAQQIISQLPSSTAGNSRLISRQDLQSWLSSLSVQPLPAKRIASRLLLTQQVHTWHKALLHPPLQIPAPAQPSEISELPSAISLSSGSVSLSFQSTQELLSHLLCLARAIELDPDSFSSRCQVPFLPPENF